MSEREETALGTARARFVEGLARRASELRGTIALLAASPDAARPREEMRRRLHALYASAQVFRVDALAAALKEGIERLDSARDERRALLQDDLDALSTLAATLPGLASGATAHIPSTRPAAIDPSSPPPPPGRRASVHPRRTTIQGLPPQTDDEPEEQTPEPIPSISEAPTVPGVARSPSLSDELAEIHRPSGSFTAGTTAPSHALLDTVISVLVIDDEQGQANVEAALPADGFEVVGAHDVTEALRLARSTAPDVVVAARELVRGDDSEFIERLRSDSLTDFVPVVLLLPTGTGNDLIAVREEGADDVLPKPVDPDRLVRSLRRVTGNLADDADGPTRIGELTPAELADRIAEEFRRGIVDAAEGGRDVKVPLGDGAGVLAATWSAIARVRSQIAQASGGKVRFRDGKGRGGPAVMALVEDAAAVDVATEVELEGRRVVVADDDPAVLWFFAGLLREEGADVFEASDGRQALEEARRRRPDVVISDILMPELDGFALCRALRRDPALGEVPVILISWKEDFLQRMRELSSGAEGYLRKEAPSAQILAKVREVLRPRARLAAQLSVGGEVRGRLEGVGMTTLLRTTADVRKDARVMARDAWNLFEVDVREGRIVAATRTATDGSFARGEPVLPQLVGMTSGRYTVTDTDAPVRGHVDGELDAVLERATSQLGAVLDSVSGKGITHAASIDFDEDALGPLLATSPTRVRELVERIVEHGPRALLVEGEVDPHELESALLDLGRRGAIRGVVGPGGEDRVQIALEERRDNRDVESVPPPAVPARDTEPDSVTDVGIDTVDDAIAEAVAEAEEAIEAEDIPAETEDTEGDKTEEDRAEGDGREGDGREGDRAEEQAAGGLFADREAAADTSEESATSLFEPQPSEAEPDKKAGLLGRLTGTDPPPAVVEDSEQDEQAGVDETKPTDPHGVPRLPRDEIEPTAEWRADEVEPTEEFRPPGQRDSDVASLDDPFTSNDPHSSIPPALNDDGLEEDLERLRPPIEPTPPVPLDVRKLHMDELEPADEAEGSRPPPVPEERPSAQADADDSAPSQPVIEHPAEGPPPAAAEEDDRQPGWLAWSVLLLALGAIGFFGFRLIEQSTQAPEVPEVEEPSEVTPQPEQVPVEPVDAGAAVLEADPLSYGETVPGIQAEDGESPQAHQGLLVVQIAEGGTAAEVSVKRQTDAEGERVEGQERELGTVPLRTYLPEGRYELVFRRGAEVSYRYLTLRRGQTRIVPAP